MSLYNMIFGRNPALPIIILLLGKERWEKLSRVRDAWVEKHNGGLQIHIYARCGGNNREEHMADWSGDELYLGDKDDGFDNTYASIYFSVPANWKEIWKEAGAPEDFDIESIAAPDPIIPEDRWAAALGPEATSTLKDLFS